MSDMTLTYYEENAHSFIESTKSVDFTSVQERFLGLLPRCASILDFGCGSGRDTKYFLGRGYQVDATDGSSEICKKASEETGINVRQMLFQELREIEKYDGIWACASILHLSIEELLPVFHNMKTALKQGGIMYTSFKYGGFEGVRNGRYFTDFTEESFVEFIKQVPGLGIEELWITSDVRPGRGEERWLNLILRKLDIR